MPIQSMYKELFDFLPVEKVKFNEPLHTYTYTKIGGPADVLVFPTQYKEVAQIASYAHTHNIPLTILGNASNVLISDSGIRGIVINLTSLAHMEVVGDMLVAQGGAALIDASKLAQQHALTGLEFACGIPGSIGGAVFMNAGAYGGEMKDVVESVLLLTKEGVLHTYTKEELAFGYRTSRIQQEGAIVLETTFALAKGNAEQINETVAHLTTLRTSKQPLEFPSCGSVFKRPPGYFAGKLIQDCDLQGTTIGGAQVSTKHAGFIVNIGHATAQDYQALIAHIQQVVKAKFDVELETEVRIIGEI